MTTQELFARVWEMLIGRTDGPLNLRFIFQPTVAAFFAIRAGVKDARLDRPPISGPCSQSRPSAATFSKRDGRTLAKCLQWQLRWTSSTRQSFMAGYFQDKRCWSASSWPLRLMR